MRTESSREASRQSGNWGGEPSGDAWVSERGTQSEQPEAGGRNARGRYPVEVLRTLASKDVAQQVVVDDDGGHLCCGEIGVFNLPPWSPLGPDYTVVMSHPLSIRFRSEDTLERLKAEAAIRRLSSSSLAEELIEEGLRLRRHPLIVFRDGATGRRAGLLGGPDIWEVVAGMVGGDIPISERVGREVDLFGLSPEDVTAALDYYAAFPDEINDEIAANATTAEESEALWRRRQQLLAG